jgi:tyrosinase
MPEKKAPFTRRSFLKTSLVAAAGAASLPITTHAFLRPQKAKYIRYNVMSEGGKRALESYAKGIQAMLNLPASHPQNWFRNAFTHLMDCPHGNWWFFVWHRGYTGFFEETIRNLSGDNTFAIPYWDWTVQPEIPDVMFDTVLTPIAKAFEPYTKTLDVFTAFIKAPMETYWNSLNSTQRAQLKIRGYENFPDMWNDVTGNGVPANMCFATTPTARYLSRTNPHLDDDTTKDCSPDVIKSALSVIEYYNQTVSLSFTSTKTPSHMTPPSGTTKFAMIEGLPHNNVHNCIGGYPQLGAGPYGNMTNFLSPIDPIFYLHHANIDRLWVWWTQKQERIGQPILPSGDDLKALSYEPFLFYVNGNGQFVGSSRAGDYLSTARFDYEYEPGFPDKLLETSQLRRKRGNVQAKGVVKGNQATLTVPSTAVNEHLAAPVATLVAEVTVPHPSSPSAARAFNVLVGAPADTTDVGANSPYLAGTVAFFGTMSHQHGPSGDATFAVPLPRTREAFKGLAATNATVEIRIVPVGGQGQQQPLLKAATIRSL